MPEPRDPLLKVLYDFESTPTQGRQELKVPPGGRRQRGRGHPRSNEGVFTGGGRFTYGAVELASAGAGAGQTPMYVAYPPAGRLRGRGWLRIAHGRRAAVSTSLFTVPHAVNMSRHPGFPGGLVGDGFRVFPQFESVARPPERRLPEAGPD
ncbi:hypothetical protein MRB53_042223 [Persea americana]|nr:hypothetical protein MRB53_042211 [Persea americana]KAJ8603256.1 hypothetical protein MRB53_042217 [Persea americana]KAJ8603262.1 hypothetical protein MRB53_042223 [Persea americana]